MKHLPVSLVVLSLGLAGPAVSSSAYAAGSGDPILACRQIDDRMDRLECYDRVVEARYGVDKEVVARREKKKRDTFGLRDPSEDESAQDLSSQITAIDDYRQMGYLVLTLANGQRWKTTTSGTLLTFLKSGQAVTIKKSGMFGYRVHIDGRGGFQGVTRVK